METWLVAIGGMVLGVVLDRTLGEHVVVPAFEWCRKHTVGRVRRRSRDRAQARFGISGEALLIGKEAHPLFVHQFAVNGFDPGLITTELLPPSTPEALVSGLPDHLRAGGWDGLATAIAQERNLLETSTVLWNAEKLALRRVELSREPARERPVLTLGFAETDYATYRTVGRLWETQESAALLDGDALRDVVPALSHSFGVNLTLETDDGHVVLTRRSPRTNGWHDRLHISVNEGMAVTDVDADGRPDPLLTCERGLKEELGVDVDRSRIRLHTLMLDVVKYEWAFLGHVDLRGTSWTFRNLRAHRAIGAAADDWESANVDACAFHPEAVIETLLDDRYTWVPHGYLNLLLSTVHRFPRERATLLERAFPRT